MQLNRYYQEDLCRPVTVIRYCSNDMLRAKYSAVVKHNGTLYTLEELSISGWKI